MTQEKLWFFSSFGDNWNYFVFELNHAQSGAQIYSILNNSLRSLAGSKSLLHNPLLQVLGQVHLPHVRGGVVGGDFGHVVLDHQLDELLEGGGLRVPAEFGLGFGRVAPEVDDVGRAVEVFGDGDYGAADKVGVDGAANGDDDTLLVDAFALPAELDAGVAEGQGGEFTDGVLDAGGNHEVLRLVVLEDEPHTLHIVLGIAPVTQ